MTRSLNPCPRIRFKFVAGLDPKRGFTLPRGKLSGRDPEKYQHFFTAFQLFCFNIDTPSLGESEGRKGREIQNMGRLSSLFTGQLSVPLSLLTKPSAIFERYIFTVFSRYVII